MLHQMQNEAIQIPTEKAKKKVKCLTIRGYTVKAKNNLKRQQAEYMRQTGKMIRLDYLATKLLETATIQTKSHE